MSRIIIFDNEGTTFDRYTIIDRMTGDVYGASTDPFAPNGFGQFNHNVADNYWIAVYGSEWRKRLYVKRCIKESVRRYINEVKADSRLGIITTYGSLPEPVRKYVKQIYKSINKEKL